MNKISQKTSTEKRKPAAAATRRRLKWVTLGMGIAALVIALYVTFMITVAFYRAFSTDLAQANYHHVETVFYDASGEELGMLETERRVLLDEDAELPSRIVQAVLHAEDRRYYEHGGIDYWSIGRAFMANFRSWERAQGGSTITQQLAKHMLGDFSRTYSRKLAEVLLAFRLESEYSKDEILRFYLDRIYLGSGYYGVEAAARGYFGKPAKNLTLGESAMLAGIIRAPTAYSPMNHPERAIERRNLILDVLGETGAISAEEREEARAQPLAVADGGPEKADSSHALAYARERLYALEGQVFVANRARGLDVHLTVRRDLQAAVESVVDRVTGQFDLDQEDPLEAAATVVDAQTGGILAMVGSRDYELSGYNRAVYARRATTSLTLPFVFGLGMEKLDLHPASMVHAAYLNIDQVAPGRRGELGDVRQDVGRAFQPLQVALAAGNRATATRIAAKLDDDALDSLFARLPGGQWELESPDEDVVEHLMTPLDAANLYGVLANGGREMETYIIERVVDRQSGDILYARERVEDSDELLTPETALQINLALQEGAAHRLGTLLQERFGLPGTHAVVTDHSPGHRDLWCVGYNPRTVAAVWLGRDDGTPMPEELKNRRVAETLWGQAMAQVHDLMPVEGAFEPSMGLAKMEVDAVTGALVGPAGVVSRAGYFFAYLSEAQRELAAREAVNSEGRRNAGHWLDRLNSLVPGLAATQTGGARQAKPAGALAGNPIPRVLRYRLPALLGDITAADGTPLATTSIRQDLVLPWSVVSEASTDDELVKAVRAKLDKASGWTDGVVAYSDQEILRYYYNQRLHPLVIARGLQEEQVDAFPQSALVAEGLALQGEPERTYPHASLAAHLVGHVRRVDAPNANPIQADDPLYTGYMGSAGLEGVFAEELSGTEGQAVIQTDAHGFPRDVRVRRQATAGGEVRTTLDLGIQKAAEEAMRGISKGACVVIDTRNGHVVAVVSKPDYDPGIFTGSMSAATWRELRDAETGTLLNRALHSAYPPGSVFKVVTTLAAMEASRFSAYRTVTMNGKFEIGSVTFNVPRDQGTVAFHEALAKSYNTYFFELGLQTGRDALVRTAERLGFGSPAGTMLGDLPGLMPNEKYVLATHDRNFGPGDICNTAIGQGDVLATPLQIARLMSIIANRGVLTEPRLVERVVDEDGNARELPAAEPRQVVRLSDSEWDTLFEGMVLASERGTARPAKVSGYQVAAKTGTAQTGSRQKPRNVAWTAGFFPASKPAYAFAVTVEGRPWQKLSSTADAAPVVGKLLASIAKQ